METKKRIYVDLDGVCADLKKLAQQRLKANPAMLYPQAEYGFFAEMEEIKDAVSSVKTLGKYFDVWFLSAPSYKNPMCLAEKNYWVRNHFGKEWPERLIISSDKSLLMGDYLIDDNATGRKQNEFKGKLILFGSAEFPTWKSVMDYFITQYNLEIPIEHDKKFELMLSFGFTLEEIEFLSESQLKNLYNFLNKFKDK